LEGNRFKRQHEQDDLEYKRAKKRIRYEKYFENQGVQQCLRYAIVSKNEQNRQKLSECKCCNNRQYYKKEREKRKKNIEANF